MSTTFSATKTSTQYITRYTYTSASAKMFFETDLKGFQNTYGAENVKWSKAKGKIFIEVTQCLFPDASDRPFVTEDFQENRMSITDAQTIIVAIVIVIALKCAWNTWNTIGKMYK